MAEVFYLCPEIAFLAIYAGRLAFFFVLKRANPGALR